jgi:hypothetical protein
MGLDMTVPGLCIVHCKVVTRCGSKVHEVTYLLATRVPGELKTGRSWSSIASRYAVAFT